MAEREGRGVLVNLFTDPTVYPAVSLYQPYAGAIRLSGLGYRGKRIETRGGRTTHRGWLVICATADDPLAYVKGEGRRAEVLRERFATWCEIEARLGAEQKELAPTWSAPALRADGLVCDDVDIAYDAAILHRIRALNLHGVAVAIARVIDCRPLLPSDERAALFYEPGRFAWILEDVTPLRPFPVQGKPGFFGLPRGQVDAAARAGLQALFERPDSIDAFETAALAWPLP